MRSLESIILERLKLSTDSKIKEEPQSQQQSQSSNKGGKDLSMVHIPSNVKSIFVQARPRDLANHVKKQEYYHNKGSNPRTLAATIKDSKKLILRWWAAVYMGWVPCYMVFRQVIENRGICTLDELDSLVYHKYEGDYGYSWYTVPLNLDRKDERKVLSEYLDNFKIKY
jgi:hypothetical protein